jgi:hypothetical protein
VKENVLRLEVAMNDAFAMRVVERGRDRRRDSNRLVDRKLLLAIETCAEALALDKRMT